jgi:hypothetical protein
MLVLLKRNHIFYEFFTIYISKKLENFTMKIYNEVITKFNDNTGEWETLSEDSEEYNGPIAGCLWKLSRLGKANQAAAGTGWSLYEACGDNEDASMGEVIPVDWEEDGTGVGICVAVRDDGNNTTYNWHECSNPTWGNNNNTNANSGPDIDDSPYPGGNLDEDNCYWWSTGYQIEWKQGNRDETEKDRFMTGDETESPHLTDETNGHMSSGYTLTETTEFGWSYGGGGSFKMNWNGAGDADLTLNIDHASEWMYYGWGFIRNDLHMNVDN